jgi:hypothetical protein
MTEMQSQKFDYTLNKVLSSFETQPQLNDDQLAVLKMLMLLNDDLKYGTDIQIKESNATINQTIIESLSKVASEEKIVKILSAQEKMYNQYSITFNNLTKTIDGLGNLSNPIHVGSEAQIKAYREGKTKNILLLMGVGLAFSIMFFGCLSYFIHQIL